MLEAIWETIGIIVGGFILIPLIIFMVVLVCAVFTAAASEVIEWFKDRK